MLRKTLGRLLASLSGPRRRALCRQICLGVEQMEDRRMLAADLRLLKDINPNLSNVSLLSHVQVGSLTYFSTRMTSGDALWKTDGTDAGTLLVREFGKQWSSSVRPVGVNNTLFFVVDSDAGEELWKSDGTFNGTTIVRDIAPGIAGAAPKYLTNVAGSLYFTASHPQTGNELWKSDGTVAGTVQVRDILPGPLGSTPTKLTAVGSTLYFSATSAFGIELFKSNGTSASTTMVRDLFPGVTSSKPSNLVNVGGTLFFSASLGGTNNGLWKTDGTASNTTLVRNFETATDTVQDELAINNRIFFSAAPANDRELWVSDGTLAGTVMVRDIFPGSTSSNPGNFTEFGGQLLFAANGPSGRELWRSNGSSFNTFLVKDINPGIAGSSPESLRRIGSTLYFIADDGNAGRELWKTNGTAAGTLLVKDSFLGPSSSFASGTAGSSLANANGKLLFAAAADVLGAPTRLWLSAGTAETTQMLSSVGTATADSVALESDPGFVNMNGTVFFAASSGAPDVRDLWKTNGTAGGTVLVKHLGGARIQPATLVNMAGILYFVTNEANNVNKLWKSDGTAAGTVVVKDSISKPTSDGLFVVSSTRTLYFLSSFDNLWKSDGTTAGTQVVSLLFSDPNTHLAFSIGTKLYFATFHIGIGNELTIFDSVSTRLGSVVKDINPGGGSSNPSRAVKVGTKYYFTADDGQHGIELWSTQGTEATTVLVKDTVPGFASSSITEMTAVGSRLFFVNADGLWKSDGTAESTVRILETTNGRPQNLVNVSGKLFFQADGGPQRGRELWKSDGTVAGTTMVRDIQPGPVGSNPADMKNIGGRLYFSAYTSSHGVELWSSNGTAAGTILEKDINPGVASSRPKYVIVLEDQMMLIATGAISGREVYAEPASIIGPADDVDFSQRKRGQVSNPILVRATVKART